jgi:CHAT domain-containing protein
VVLGNLGAFNLETGEPEKAIDLFEQEIALYRQVGDRKGEALSLTDLGRADSQAGQTPEAVERFHQALAIEREIGDRAGEAATLSHLGFTQTVHGSPREALEPLTRSLALWHEIGDLAAEGRAQHFLGLAQAALGDAPAALAAFGEALRLRRSVGDAAGEVATLQEIGRAEMARGNLEAARAALEPALEKVAALRFRISADRLRSSYFASLRDAYELEIDLLMSLHARQPAAGFDAMAFQTAERARARSLLDLLREARVEIRRGADPALLDEERRLRVGLDAKAERLTRVLAGKPTPEQAAGARRELAEAETAYELAEGRLRAALPAYGNLVHPEPVKLAEIQALLDGDTVLLEIAPGEKRSFLWKVTPTSLASFELPARAVIEKAAREAYASLSSPNAQEGARRREPLDRLGRLLFGPLAGGLSGKRLAVVAGEALQYVPLAALTLPSGEPVIDRYEVVSLPSAAVLGELRRKAASRPPAAGALAVLADPVFGEDDPRVRKAGQASAPAPRRGEEIIRGADLERAARDAGAGTFPRLAWTRREAELATAQAGERKVLVALDFQANRETATGPELARYRVVHFATHGLLDSRHPEISGLVLSLVDEQGRPRDGFLRLPDIYNLDLGAELVVLSGCQTALGREIRGEGLMGMSRGFFYAGASEVLASLWAVRDRATAELMQRFYRAMFQQGLSPAAALRAAQLSMRREPRWRDPYFWAAFNLQGDWRSASPGPAGTR